MQRNYAAIDLVAASGSTASRPARSPTTSRWLPLVPDHAPDFVKQVTARIMAGEGDLLPVSAMPVDGTFPTATTQLGEARHRPADPDLGAGALHRLRQVRHRLPARRDPHEGLPGRRAGARARRLPLQGVQVARAASTTASPSRWRPDDCTGCGVCVDVCPAKDKTEVRRKAINLAPYLEHRDLERRRWDHFLSIPPARPRASSRATRSRAHRSWSRSSSSPEPAPAAARRPTSSSSASSSATA